MLGGAPLSEEAARRRWVGRLGVRRIWRLCVCLLRYSCGALLHSPGNAAHARLRNGLPTSQQKRRCRMWRLGRPPHRRHLTFVLYIIGRHKSERRMRRCVRSKGGSREARRVIAEHVQRDHIGTTLFGAALRRLRHTSCDGVCVSGAHPCGNYRNNAASPRPRGTHFNSAELQTDPPTDRQPPHMPLAAHTARSLHRAPTCQTRRRCGPACVRERRCALR